MITNYFKIAFRNIIRYSTLSILNISGMAIGMACAILCFLWIQKEVTWDRFHKNADYLYRVIVNHRYSNGELRQEIFTPIPMTAALKDEFPEIIRSSRYAKFELTLPKGDELITEEVSFVDKDFFKMFNIEFIRGDINRAFSGPYDLIITEEMAQKYFADEDPFGKKLNYKSIVFTVTGVAKTLPQNSFARLGLILPYELLMKPEMKTGLKNDWNYAFGSSLVELNEGSDNKSVEDKIKDIIKRNVQDIDAEIFLQNIKKIHLYSARKFYGEFFFLGSITYIRLASLVAVLILIIACINFINLTTAQSARRVKEIGVRKVAGATQRKIIIQFLGESMLIVFVAHIIAMILVELLLPGFNNIMYNGAKEMEVNYKSASLYIGLISIVLFCGLLAGGYPALYFSSLQPISTLKGIILKNTSNTKFRRILVVSQFTLSFLFIICTLIVSAQLNYIQNKDLGLNIENVVHFDFTDGIKRETLKNELSNNPDILSITITGHQNVLSNWSFIGDLTWEGKKEGNNVSFYYLCTDRDFANTFNISLKNGRFLSADEFSGNKDEVINIVINEKAVEILGFKNPIGEVISDKTGLKFNIIGVVEDFHFKMFRFAIDPLIITPIFPSTTGGSCYVKIKPDQNTSTMNISDIFKSHNLDYTPILKFLDNEHDRMYRTEHIAGKMLGYLSFLTIIISCLGLIGLSTFMIVRRTKEIGIRKSHGAKSSEIFSLLSKEYIILVLISFIIASPIAWYATSIWLQSFVYRVELGWWVFVLALVITMLITMLTVGFQSYRAAFRNPVEALRYE